MNLRCNYKLFDACSGWIVTFLDFVSAGPLLAGRSLLNNRNACFFFFLLFSFFKLLLGHGTSFILISYSTIMTLMLSVLNLPLILPPFIISRLMMLKVKSEKSFLLVFAQTQMTLSL